MGLLFLIGAAVMGVGLVRALASDWLDGMEQAAWGLVVGWMIATWWAYDLALWEGHLAGTTLAWLTAGIGVLAAGLWLPRLSRTSGDSVVAGWRAADKPFLLLLGGFFLPVYAHLFKTHMFEAKLDGLYSGGACWADINFHLAITHAFLHAANFPPEYPIFTGEALHYPFLPDFQTAALMAVGMTAWQALTFTGVPLVLAITTLLYTLGRRILRSRAAAALATLLFIYNGGFGFVAVVDDWRKSHVSLGDFWLHMHTNYTRNFETGLHWANVLVDSLLPQRANLYGMSVAFMVIGVFALVWERWHEAPDAGDWDGWRPLAVAGAVTALLPLFHSMSYMAVGLLSGFLFLLKPRRVWLAYWLAAVLFALPQLGAIVGHATGSGFMYFRPGWMMHFYPGFKPAYGLWNIGLPLLLVIPAWWVVERRWRRFYLSFVALMTLCLLVSLSPHEYNNIKLMYYWYALTCILVAGWLVRLAREKHRPVLAFACCLVSVLAGILTLHSEFVTQWRCYGPAEMRVADFVQRTIAPKAIFLTSQQHDQPIVTLTGRPLVLGYSGWLTSHGYSVLAREQAVSAIYAGKPTAMRLLRQYGVDYVYVGPAERANPTLNEAFFQTRFRLIYHLDGIALYDTRKPRLASG